VVSRQTVNFLVGLLFVLSAALGLFLVARAIWAGFTSLEGGVATATVGAAGAVLLATVNNAAQRYADRRREIEERQRAQKLELYQRFMEFWFEVLFSNGNRETTDEVGQDSKRSQSDMNYLKQQMILWGQMACSRVTPTFTAIQQIQTKARTL